jgi:tetratricopeptide (TPR) repeat protein
MNLKPNSKVEVNLTASRWTKVIPEFIMLIMRTRQQTKILTSLGLAALFSTSVPQELPIQQLSPETRAEINRQHARFAALAKAGKYDEAERALDALEGLNSNFRPGRLRADLALRRGDFSEALTHFKSECIFRQPDNGERRFSFQPEEQVWYYFLNVQAGNLKEAKLAFDDLRSRGLRNPMKPQAIDISECSRNPLAVLYVHLATVMNSQGNFYRMKIYLELARKIYPKIKLDEGYDQAMKERGFSEKFNLDFETKYGSGYPIVDYRVYEKVTKSKAKLF